MTLRNVGDTGVQSGERGAELHGLADSVVAMYDGEVTGELVDDEICESAITRAALIAEPTSVGTSANVSRAAEALLRCHSTIRRETRWIRVLRDL
jgi:hypothetical protein